MPRRRREEVAADARRIDTDEIGVVLPNGTLAWRLPCRFRGLRSGDLAPGDQPEHPQKGSAHHSSRQATAAFSLGLCVLRHCTHEEDANTRGARAKQREA
jgi:hypothetical protein